MATTSYLTYVHRQSEITDLKNFLDGEGSSIALAFKGKERSFVEYDGGTGVPNLTRIKSLYTPEELESETPKRYADMLLKVGTVLLIPRDQINAETLLTEGANEINESTTFNAFLSATLRQQLASGTYKQVLQSTAHGAGEVVRLTPDISVWMWCRALAPEGAPADSDELTGRLIDITPFVQQVSTGNTATGGNFQLTLTPLSCEPDEKGGWRLKADSIRGYTANNVKEHFVAQSGLHRVDDAGALRRNQFLFHNIVSANDLVFIRYETLEGETSKRGAQNAKMGLSFSDIPGNNFDMIGLVDAASLVVSPAGNEVGISVSGRDCIKLFIEDGCYFYPLEYAANIFSNKEGDDSALVNRVYGKIENLAAYSYRSISYALQFVFNQLANTGLVPDEVFAPYGPRLSTYYRDTSLKRQQDLQRRMDNAKLDGLNSIRDSREAEGIASPTNEKQVVAVWNELLSFIRAGRKEKKLLSTPEGGISARSFTYKGEKIGPYGLPRTLDGKLFIRQTTEGNAASAQASTALQNAFAYVVAAERLSDVKPETSELPRKGLWGIVDLLIDESVAKMRLVDSSISVESGSIFNYINKICRDPFVEFFTDTYGDKFECIVRRPPFTQQAYTELADIALEHFVIKARDVLDEQLQWDDSAVYTWFKLVPQGLFMGEGSQVSLAYFPAVQFPEYVAHFGSRPLDIVTNYVPFNPLRGKNSKSSQNYLERQGYQDLKYLVDTHAYLPFTRTGTITTNRDRRYRRGCCVYLESTNEICYVDAVSHSHVVTEKGVDAVSILQVSRCMVLEYIKGKDGFSYFDIIKTPLSQRDGEFGAEVLRGWGVDRKQFAFFVRRNQLR
jgi:hypothetical protein